MGSRQTVTGTWIINFVIAFLSCMIHLAEAQTQVGFEFREKYSLIADDVDNFKSHLRSNILELYTFAETEVSPLKVTDSSGGRILVNFTLRIDTTVKAKILARSEFEQSLRTENYVLPYNGTLYNVDNITVWIKLSVSDIWHQYAPEIVIVSICGLAALAIFVSSIQLLCMNRKRRRKDVYALRNSLPVSHSGNSLGRTNGGFMMDEMNGGHRVHTPKSSIGSTRFNYERDTLYDKLIYSTYEVPPKHMYNFL